MLLGVLVGSWEDSFSQNNKRQICEAYVRRNMNLLLISFQLKKKKISNLSSPSISDPICECPDTAEHRSCVLDYGARAWDKHFQFSMKPCLPYCLVLSYLGGSMKYHPSLPYPCPQNSAGMRCLLPPSSQRGSAKLPQRPSVYSTSPQESWSFPARER